jgi:hypothetical protein
MSHLNNISGKFPDSKSHLHTVYYILTSKTPSVKPSQNNDTNPVNNDNEDELEIKSKMLDFEEHLTQFTTERQVEITASPKHQKQEFNLPESWSHDRKCSCLECSDIDVAKIGLNFVLCFGEMYVMSGAYQLAKSYLTGLFDRIDAINSKGFDTLREMLPCEMQQKDFNDLLINKICGNGDGDKKNVFEMASCLYQAVLVEGYKLMIYMALIDLDLQEHQVIYM